MPRIESSHSKLHHSELRTDISVRVYQPYRTYIQKKYPSINYEEILRSVNLDPAYMNDPSNWISFQASARLTKALKYETKNEKLCFHVGRHSIDETFLGKMAIIAVANTLKTTTLLKYIPKGARAINRTMELTISENTRETFILNVAIISEGIEDESKGPTKDHIIDVLENTAGIISGLLRKRGVRKLRYTIERLNDSNYTISFQYNAVTTYLETLRYPLLLSLVIVPVYFASKSSPRIAYVFQALTIVEVLLVLSSISLLTLSLVLFVKLQRAIASLSEIYDAKDKENLRYSQLRETEKSLIVLDEKAMKFVPNAIVKLMGIQSIGQIRADTNIEKKVTAMFFDIEGFTALTEKWGDQETLAFLNRLFQGLGPLVSGLSGVVDKYTGDGFLCIFPDHCDDAIRASIAIYNEIENLSLTLGLRLRARIGLTYGQVCLGVIGYPDRLEVTAISKHINVASRLEVLNKTLFTRLLVTQDLLENTTNAFMRNIRTRYLGKIQVRGYQEPVSVHEIYDVRPPEEVADIEISAKPLENVIRDMEKGIQWAANFSDLSKRHPKDPTLAALFDIHMIAQAKTAIKKVA